MTAQRAVLIIINVSYVSRIFIFVRADDDRVGSEVGEVEAEGEGSLAQLLDESRL